jgi:hypothetical protein
MKKRIFGIATKHQSAEDLNFEHHAIYQSARKLFDSVLLIDPREVTYQFIRGTKKPIILHNGEDISNLTVLYLRGFKYREASTAILVRSLNLFGCRISDPITRFTVGYPSKLLTTYSRFRFQVGASSFIGFSHQNTIDMINNPELKQYFPLIAKPIAGKRGRGIELLNTIEEALQYLDTFFEERGNPDLPVLLQTYISIKAEYRVFLIDGKVLGMAEKIAQPGQLQANAAQGAEFKARSHPALSQFVAEKASSQGILGVDAAIDANGDFYIIETNRAPQWKAFEEATGIDVSDEIVRRY